MTYPSNGGPPLDDEAARVAKEVERLKGMTYEEAMREGQKALVADLVSRVRSGTANHQEKAILRNLLKDNGLTLGIPPEKPPEASPPADLPHYPDPDYS